MIKMKKLDSSFGKYGSFLNPADCGLPLGGEEGPVRFYPDRILQLFNTSNLLAFSVLELRKRPLEITSSEIHLDTEEVFGGFSQDVCFYVGPEAPEPSVEEFEAFYLPKGWWVRVKRRIWHQAPFVLGEEPAVGIVSLPPWTYNNDFELVELDEPVKIEVDM